MATLLDSVHVDCTEPDALGQWWATTLNWSTTRHGGTAAEHTTTDVSVDPPPGRPGVPLRFTHSAEGKIGPNRVHIDLRSGSTAEQAATVDALERHGARRIDIGQGDVPFDVLADPQGNEFCVLDPRDEYAHTGRIAAIVMSTLDPISLAPFWAAVTGWDVAVANSRYAALKKTKGPGPLLELIAPVEPTPGTNRWRLVVRPTSDSHGTAEVQRLRRIGATTVGRSNVPREVGWILLADPEGTEFAVVLGDNANHRPAC